MTRGGDVQPMELSQSGLVDSMDGMALQEDLVNSAYSQSLDVSQVDLMNDEVDGGARGAASMVLDDEDEPGIDEAEFEDENLAAWLDRPGVLEGCLLDVGQLQAVKEIGAGAFSTIYLAKYGAAGEVVAVKRSNLQLRAKFPPEVMFAREVEFLRDLRPHNHPNIVRLVGANRTAEQGVVAVEFVLGGSLSAVVHERNVPLQVMHVVQIGRGICNGMAFLHRSCILHRDLTSENVMLKTDGVCKLIDFGFAVRVPDAAPACVYKLRPAGNARWRAPEITLRMPYGSSADVYSFGVILNEVLSRQRPFQAVARSRDVAQLATRGGRPDMLFVGTDPLRDVIVASWNADPFARPTFLVLLQRLSDIFQKLLAPP
jgi:serine/threonine protein kinase